MSECNPPLTLSQVIEGAKNGDEVPQLDLLYAVIALESLCTFNWRALGKLADRERIKGVVKALGTAQHEHEEGFRRFKTALEAAPINWVGWENDPFNPDYQKRRKISEKILQKVLSEPTA